MQEIVRVNLENEMDLILAHKRSMKLAELCGLTLASQTTFATAVSEIARCAISFGDKSYLLLQIHLTRFNRKEIVASIFDKKDLTKAHSEAIAYAKKLMGDITVKQHEDLFEIQLSQYIQFGGTISPAKVESFKEFFKKELSLSPYDELRKKNIHLIDLADKLKGSENQYKQLTDSLPQMMFTTNANGNITFSNRGLKEYFGAQNLSDGSLTWKTMLHASDYPMVIDKWEKSRNAKIGFSTEARLVSPDAKNHTWHIMSMVPVKNEDDVIIKWHGFFVDIEAQKQVEETLKNNRELKETKDLLVANQELLEEKIRQLNTSNNDLEQFAYIASHDLQEPLRKIQTFSQLLKNAKGNEELTDKYMDKIMASTSRMSELIKAVLNYSRISNIGVEKETVDLNAIIQGISDDFELTIAEKQATLNISPLPPIKGVALQMHQLFYNLISNALKFSTTGITIEITGKVIPKNKVREEAIPIKLNPAWDYAMILVSDNGIGFEQRFADKIFTIFQRLHHKQSYSGTGIGLALCKKIVDKHNGYIYAKSEPNMGAKFFIYLPIEGAS